MKGSRAATRRSRTPVARSSSKASARTSAGTRVFVFDLDDTITRSDTFLSFLVGYLIRNPRRWIITPHLAWAVAMFASGRRDNSWLKTYFLQRIVGNQPRTIVDRWVSRFVDRVVARDVLPAARAEIERLREQDAILVLASASPDIYVEPLAARLGFRHIVCTRVERLPDGRWSGRLDGKNCYGIEKQRRVEAALRRLGFALRDATFYSDHHSDAPLFESAGHAFAVNPTEKLSALAAHAGIPVLHWRS